MEEKFTKDDIKPGMVVMTRDGLLYIVFVTNDNNKILLNNVSGYDLDDFNDNLQYYSSIESSEDIVKVYQTTNSCVNLKNVFDSKILELVWSRKDTIVLDFDDVARRLGIDPNYFSIRMSDGTKISKKK